jgi:hypothetical protein
MIAASEPAGEIAELADGRYLRVNLLPTAPTAPRTTISMSTQPSAASPPPARIANTAATNSAMPMATAPTNAFRS